MAYDVSANQLVDECGDGCGGSHLADHIEGKPQADTPFRIDGKLMIAGSYAGADADPA